MGFKERLKEKLKEIPEDKLDSLPRGFQFIGEIIIINLHKDLIKYKKKIGEAVLELFPRIKTICNKKGIIKGDFRVPQLEVIAGEKNTETIHLEHGIKYKFDVCKIMFAKGNVSERQRLPKQIKKEEVIVDMFAGIGYFTLAIGKTNKPSKIYAIELNPDSYKYLNENLKINYIHNVQTINGDSKEQVQQLVNKGIKADRVLMGLLPPPKDFISDAIKIIKKGGMIHYDDLVGVDNKDKDLKKTADLFDKQAKKLGMKAKLFYASRVKSYGPKIDHYVLDIKIS